MMGSMHRYCGLRDDALLNQARHNEQPVPMIVDDENEYRSHITSRAMVNIASSKLMKIAIQT